MLEHLLTASWDSLRTFGLLALVFVPLERLVSLHKQKIVRAGFFVDLAWYFINGILTPLLVTACTLSVVHLLRRVIPLSFVVWMEGRPLWFLVPASLVVGEVGYYWAHRLCHEVPFLWRFHALHHSAEEMDWLVNTRVHPFEIAFTTLFKTIPLLILGLSRPLGGRSVLTAFLVAEGSTWWTFLIHSNIKWRFGLLKWILSTPAFHHWHHSNDGPEYGNRNYASVLSFVDLMFGTYSVPKDRTPQRYGIHEPMPPGVISQLVKPF